MSLVDLRKIFKANHTRRLMFSTADQAILSIVNFGLSFILLKILSKDDFGLYNLIIPISLIFTSLQNALINTPLMVEYWNLDKEKRAIFVGSLTLLQKRVIALLIILIFSIAGIFFILTNNSKETFIIFSFSILLAGILSREYLRNYFFTIELPEKAVWNDFRYLILMVCFILAIYLLGMFTISAVLTMIGLSSIISSMDLNNRLINHNDFGLARKHFLESFNHGKWALLGVIVTHIQTYGYIYLVGLFFATKDVGELAAIRLLFIPFSFITVGYSKIAIPRGSKLISEKKYNKFIKEEFYFSIFYSTIILIYTVIVNLLPEKYLIMVLKKEYISAIEYIPYYSIITILSIWGSTGSNGLQSFRKFEILSKINSVSMFIVLTMTFILIQISGIKGALLATIVGQLSNILGMWYYFNKLSK